MIFLFIHQNFPGQYKHVVKRLASDPTHQVFFITQPNENRMQGVTKISYTPTNTNGDFVHPFAIGFDRSVRVGMGVVEACRMLSAQGIKPDLICGHAGWGEMLFVKDVFPEAPILSYFEFYYHMHNVDTDFDHEFAPKGLNPFGLRTRNAVGLLSFDAVDWGHTPTLWQRSVHPPEMRKRLPVLHEGVDTDLVKPDPTARIFLERDQIWLGAGDEVITYVARGLEPYRGFHIMMRASVEILRRRPKARIIFIGGDDVSYGSPPEGGGTFRELMLRELEGKLDLSRVHFLGKIPYEAYLKVLHISAAHIYLTFPFVLSWSFIEAMAAGCAMIGSATPPVMEVLKHGENGLLVDFFSIEGIADAVDALLNDRNLATHLRAGARRTAVESYDLNSRIMPKWMHLFEDLINRKKPTLIP